MGVSVVDGSATIPITKRFRERARGTNRPGPSGCGAGAPFALLLRDLERLHVARIAGVNIPTNKRVVIALQYIHGIGAAKARDIMDAVGLPAERRVSQLTDAE